jgi:ABC-type sugar transport system ATPase subunit
MSVAENIFIGKRHFGMFYTRQKLKEKASPFLELVGLEHLDPATPAGTLSVAERHLVEVARMVSREARILILDEPTASLDEDEIDRVKRVVRSLAGQDRSVIYVTHRLPEVFDLADRVTVLRNGEGRHGIPVSELTPESLIERMIGRSLQRMFPPRAIEFGAEVLAVHDLCADELKTPVTLSVRSGEIFGLAGQIGSGAGGLLNAVAGIRPVVRGRIELKGQTLLLRGRQDAIAAGIAYCSAERKKDGLFNVRTLTENLTSPALHRVTPRGWLDQRKEKDLAGSLARFFQIDVDRLGHSAGTLSGGNQQKVALGKWLGVEPAVLLVEEPTPGVDVGARAEIYAHLRRMANEGLAVVFASSDIQEVLGLADRIGTFYHGRLIKICSAEETDMARLTMDVTSPGDPGKNAS